jgi:ribonuclease T2
MLLLCKAVAFFETVVMLFKTLPTYNWLADAGITPSSSETYTLSSLLSALEAGSGGVSYHLIVSEVSHNNVSSVHSSFGLSVAHAQFNQLVLQSQGFCH